MKRLYAQKRGERFGIKRTSVCGVWEHSHELINLMEDFIDVQNIT
jgi:hypothetical protein